MRTTLDIDDPVLEELKRRQREESKSPGKLASELLARALAESRRKAIAARLIVDAAGAWHAIEPVLS